VERLTAWNALRTTEQNAASQLGYNECSWNIFYTNDIEDKPWSDLSFMQITLATSLGFDENSWDCWQNHYGSYTWSELQLKGVAKCYEDLGWSESAWLGLTTQPDTDTKLFSALTNSEKDAAECLCFPEPVWDQEVLGTEKFGVDYCDEIPATVEASDTLCSAMTIWGTPCSPIRYNRYSTLNFFQRGAAVNNLGYSKESWNNVTETTAAESIAYESLSFQQLAGAIVLGYILEESWDCYQHHYADYTWDNLDEAFVQDCAVALGYDEDMWNSGAVSPLEEVEFASLTSQQKQAAECMCYFESIWEGDTLDGGLFDDSFC